MQAMPLGQDDVTKLSDSEIEQRFKTSGWGSPHFMALVEERQRRQLIAVHSILERSEKLAGKLEQQMDKLLGVAEAQKLLAAKLERQTNRLICLTYVLVFLTAALFAVAFAQTRIMLNENAATHPAGIDTSQHDQTPSTNR